jgi:hypothetical protein
MEWAQSLRGRDPEIRQVSPATAALAYRGLVRAHAQLVEGGAVQHGSSAGNVPFAKRRQQMNRAIGDLAQLRARLIEGGHLPLPGFTRPSAG